MGRVVENDIKGYEDYGVVRVALPDFMVESLGTDGEGKSIDLEINGILAYPANNPVGGRSVEELDKEHWYQGSVYIPPRGSTVWVFFQDGDLESCFYWNAVNYQYSKLPPEQTTADEPHKVFTVLKTHQGRAIVVSDDENTQRVEITGKKRTLSGTDPAGNSDSTYTIDDNQTTVFLDEREGTEKLLIRTYKGDFIHVDIDERKLQIEFNGDINIKTSGSFSVEAGKDIQMKADGSAYLSGDQGLHLKSNSQAALGSADKMNIFSGSIIALDGSQTFVQSGKATDARTASPNPPEGERDT